MAYGNYYNQNFSSTGNINNYSNGQYNYGGSLGALSYDQPDK